MSSLWAVMRTEIRLAWRRHTFWIVQVVWLLPLALTLVSNLGNATALRQAQDTALRGDMFIGEQLVISLMTWLVLLPLIIGPALIRDLDEVGEILWATPLDGLRHLLGVSIGLLAALLPALLVHLVALWLVGYVLIGAPAGLFWRYGPHLFLASTVAGMSLAIMLALLLRRTLLLLLVWVVLWAGVLQMSLGFFGALGGVALASPVNLFFYNLQVSPSLGLGPSKPLVQGLVVWFIGSGVLVVLLAVGMAVIADRRRAVRPSIALATWILLAGLLAGGGRLLHARAVGAQSIPTSPANIQAGMWHVETHILEVTVEAARNTLTGTSTLRLAPSGSTSEAEVVLRLNPGLVLTHVRGAAGQPLGWDRVGDSVVVQLPTSPASPLTLHLQWYGTPRLPYIDYREGSSAGYPAFDTPQPARALLAGGAGYLLRDGDWYPWPWGEMPRPQQADDNQVRLHVVGGDALAPIPLDDGLAAWEGELPSVFLVLPPSGTQTVNGRTLYFGSFGGTDTVLITRLAQIAELIPKVAEALGAEPAPTRIVALPYLHDLVWSGDLLLVPEGTGFLRGDLRSLLLSPRPAAVGADMETRAVMMALARAWLADHIVLPAGWIRVRSDVGGVVALTGIPGEAGVVRLPSAADDPHGRWIRSSGPTIDLLPSPSSLAGDQQPLEGDGQDLRTMVKTRLNSADQLDLLALWLAVELADPAVRGADLAVLLALPDPSSSSSKFEPFLLRSLPVDFPVGHAPKAALVEALHTWVEEVGREQALHLVGEVVRNQAGTTFNLESLLETLEQRSHVAITYEEGK